ncbi:hypothetical protein PIB30_083241 [Stylosanthes scabra]|uniref:Uncharacterized protein n=1 Tax=Stylosanthes scabra TaxID=79078 RepID=A0ABU6WQI3_9FABA|nr:hypothetical protein [Stylosanthes scabra]
MGSLLRTHLVQQWPSRFCCDPFVPLALSGHFRSEHRHERSARGVATRGIRIDYAASKDETRQKMSCHKSLQLVLKYRVWDSGRSPNELTEGTILVVRKTGVTIVSVSEWKLKERYREKLIKMVLGHGSRYHVSP